MYISNNSANIAFTGPVSLKRASFWDSRKTSSFEVEHPSLNTLNVSSHKLKKTHNDEFVSSVVNSANRILATEKILINKSKHELYGCSIKTNERYRYNSLGEILRLSGIITMFENKANKMRICSIGDAAVFHAKYKFEPDISTPLDAEFMLYRIADSKSKKYSQKAHEILNEYDFDKCDDEQLQNSANSLVKELLDDIVYNKYDYDRKDLKHWSLDMVLTKENVLNNKEFFNNLYKKHGIEYEIN
ncbi:hypothetical protein IJZ97_01380 [bacterium]|nr:hypothetical protein [bacterium]